MRILAFSLLVLAESLGAIAPTPTPTPHPVEVKWAAWAKKHPKVKPVFSLGRNTKRIVMAAPTPSPK